MTPEQAQAIYFAGQEAVVTYLCELDAQVQALQQEIEALQRKVDYMEFYGRSFGNVEMSNL